MAMLQQIQSVVDKAQNKCALYEKQCLRAQMLKDKINGPVLKRTEEEIGLLNLQLYGHASKQQRA